MTEEEFRQKYPHSTDEQVRLYCEAVALEAAGVTPVVEPDIPMPMITVPERQIPTVTLLDNYPQATLTSYTAPQFYTRNFSLDDVPPEMPGPLSTAGSQATANEMRDVLLGPFNSHLTAGMRHLFQTTDMSADDMLSMFFDPKQPTQSVRPN